MLAVVAVLAVVVYAAGGWYYSGRIDNGALALTQDDGSPVYDLTVVGVSPGRVVLAASGEDAPDNLTAPSSYLLRWPGGSGRVSPPTGSADGDVVRSLTAVTGAAPTVGAPALLSRNWYDGTDPSTALGVAFTTVQVDGPLGALPAWWVPAGSGTAARSTPTAAVLVHGKGGRPEEFLRMLPTLQAAGVSALVVSYRNDLGVAGDPSGRYGWGTTEWPDLAAAVEWVGQRGAQRVVLVGDSMGGAIIAAFMQRSSLADQVSGIVLDSPALDLSDGVALGASQSTIPVIGVPVPSSLTWVAERIAGLRFGVDWGAVDYADDSSWVRVPVLVLHGDADPSFPVSTSERFAAANPDAVTLVVIPGAQHLESWNTDRAKVEAEVEGFLARVAA